jgi:hypothetical protein
MSDKKTGDKMVDVGKQITGFVWAVFFLIVIIFLIWHVSTS